MKFEIRTLKPEDLPPQLKETPYPPAKLFIKGANIDLSSKLLVVVGSRRHSPYGKEACEKIIKGLSGYNITIISGLAIGIDSIAHRAAIEAGLKTIAIPGSGLDPKVIYPRQNATLAEQILESGGTLLSEFEEDFKAHAGTFPQRNRIMAGLSDAVLVIEAEERSGTLITARMATDYNRDVLAVPGSIFSLNSKGSNFLIRQGACPITCSADVLQALSIEENIQKEVVSTQDLSEKEKMVIELINVPTSKDELIERLGLSVSEANILLSAMEIKGLVREELGKLRKT
jgi:DNA processing protein